MKPFKNRRAEALERELILAHFKLREAMADLRAQIAVNESMREQSERLGESKHGTLGPPP